MQERARASRTCVALLPQPRPRIAGQGASQPAKCEPWFKVLYPFRDIKDLVQSFRTANHRVVGAYMSRFRSSAYSQPNIPC